MILDRVPQVAGTHVNGTVRVAAAGLNELLRAGPAPLSGCDVAVAAGNRVVVRYGMLRATATIDGVETGPSPRLQVSLASFVVALAVRAALRQPFVQVRGRLVVVDLGAVPALRPYAALFPHVRRVDIETAPGELRVGVEILVSE